MESAVKELGIQHFDGLFCINPLPNNKILDWSKLKAFADNKMNVTKNLKFGLGRVENMVGKGENAIPTFSPFPFPKASFQESLKVGIV